MTPLTDAQGNVAFFIRDHIDPLSTRCIALRCMCRRGGKSRMCHRHDKKLWRHRYPHRALFHMIKDRARRKGLAFNITLDWFVEFTTKHGYKKGSRLHIDRKDWTIGYTIENVQVLVGTDNIIKGNKERAGKDVSQYISDEDPF